MSKFIMACLLIGAVFYSGIYFGQNLSDHPGKTGKEETMFSEYEEWKDQQKIKEEERANETKIEKTYDENKDNVYSLTANGISNVLKSTSRTIIFQFLSAFEKAIHTFV
ncbi:hypothetical protein DCC39_05610 [Pueribacillus theae]|uniref:Uncharacterized protein n=1 Tax=Pueribacillus theae TaxID=2171751 RepID=A0A2U1K5P3_9BACI|nr:hypothetical protein [Pueribacillus theae]PWA12489.1 hypothetical protein DCC39_05610 [Pueribacillus theae]